MTEQPVVYFVRMGPYVKIGTSVNPAARMAQLGLPMRAVVATIIGGPAVEHALHVRFARTRIDGTEWFAMTVELEDYLASIGASRPGFGAPGAAALGRRAKPDLNAHPEIPARMIHTIKEGAILLGITVEEVQDLIREGVLPAVKMGSRPCLRRADIKRFADAFPWAS